MLSFNSTRLELCRTKLAPLKLARILILVIALLNIVQKASKKVFFLTCVIAYFAQLLISTQYACFSSAKQPTLSSYNRCNKCRGMQRRIILCSLQQSLNSVELQLLQLLIISRQYALIVQSFVHALQCFSYCNLSLFVIQLLSLVVIT